MDIDTSPTCPSSPATQFLTDLIASTDATPASIPDVPMTESNDSSDHATDRPPDTPPRASRRTIKDRRNRHRDHDSAHRTTNRERPPPDQAHQAASDRSQTNTRSVKDGQTSKAAPATPTPAPEPTTATQTTAKAGTWLLRFDGACKGNPGVAGVGAHLSNPNGTTVWTLALPLPGKGNTNNTAEYAGLIAGLQSAVIHQVQNLDIEGDSNLILAQVKGEYGVNNPRLKKLRRQARDLLKQIQVYTIQHIDRLANKHADRLANQGLRRTLSRVDCATHGTNGTNCWTMTPVPTTPASTTMTATTPPTTRRVPPNTTEPVATSDSDETSDAEAEARIARRDNGRVFPVHVTGPDVAPARRPRLQLRRLTDDDDAKAHDATETFAKELIARLDEADDWSIGEGYLAAFAPMLYESLTPFMRRGRNSEAGSKNKPRPPARPPRTTITTQDHRLDQALDDLAAVQAAPDPDRRAITKARRRAGRARSAINRKLLRRNFQLNEKDCIHKLLAPVSSPDDTPGALQKTCPIPKSDLQDYFVSMNTPRRTFDYEATEGAAFRTTIETLLALTQAANRLTDSIDEEEIEDQLQRTTATSSPGLEALITTY